MTLTHDSYIRGALFSNDDRWIINKHINDTQAMLKRLPFPPHRANVPEIAGNHHEKMDGSGYPHRQKGEGISLLARMGAVCDVYDAVTSERPYKAGWAPAEAIKKMSAWCNGHFDEAVFRAFVKCIGIYPVGTLVRLTSGRLGVVTEQTAKSLVTPMIKIFFSTKSGVHVRPEMLDLSRAAGGEKIVAIENPEKWGIKNLEKYWVE